MAKMVAYCGLVCSDCQTFLDTQSDYNEGRKMAEDLYSKKFGIKLNTKDINCDGCLSNSGRLTGYCKNCEIRKCCVEKGLENCTVCKKQPCEKLKKLHDFSPEAKICFESLLKE